MATLREIAENPRKALSELEKQLKVRPGDLVRDMEGLAAPEDWARHLPYRDAVSYYDDDRARASYEAHVDACQYCKALLDSLHPTAGELSEFSSRAARLHSGTRRGWTERVAPYALAASVLIAAFGGWALVRSESLGLTTSPAITHAAAQAWVGDLKIGSGTDLKDASVSSKVESIPAGKPVQLQTEIHGAPNRTPISVIWVGPNNQKVHAETNWTRAGEKSIAFTAPDTKEWKTGEYRAEVWIADKKIKEEPFELTGAVAKAE